MIYWTSSFCAKCPCRNVHRHWADRFADQGEKCREVSLSMTLRFSDLLPVQEVENVLPSDAEIWPIFLGFGDVFELEFG